MQVFYNPFLAIFPQFQFPQHVHNKKSEKKGFSNYTDRHLD